MRKDNERVGAQGKQEGFGVGIRSSLGAEGK